jgi:hypothetical protein
MSIPTHQVKFIKRPKNIVSIAKIFPYFFEKLTPQYAFFTAAATTAPVIPLLL